jgi:hypothetical protein
VDRRRGNEGVTVTGGVLIEIPPITTAAEWCELHGLPVVDGVVTLFKAVDDDWSTDQARFRGMAYAPGAAVEAADWDPEPECGGGIHLSPSPRHAREFNPSATRFVGCPVRVDDLVVHCPATYPDKVKAPRVGPCIAVDVDGEPIEVAP